MVLEVGRLNVVFAVLALLSGCSHWYGNDSYFHNNDSAYLTSSNGRELIVPPPLTKQYITHYYRLPQQTQNAEIDINPPAVNKDHWKPHYVPAIDANEVRSIDEGLLVAKPVAQTWILIGSALKRKSISVVKVDRKRFIYYLGKSGRSTVRIKLVARGSFDTAVFFTDIHGKPLEKKQWEHLRRQISRGMQGKSNYSLTGFWRS